MTAIVKKKMKHELIRMKKEEINPQQNNMKFEVEVPLKQLEPSIKIIIIIIIINMHKTKHKERNWLISYKLKIGKQNRLKTYKLIDLIEDVL